NPATAYNPLQDGFLNVFGDGSNSNERVLSAIRAPLEGAPFRSKWTTQQATLSADGTVINLRGRDVRLAAGVDVRRVRGDTTQVIGFSTGTPRIDLEQDVRAVFAELRVPLIV